MTSTTHERISETAVGVWTVGIALVWIATAFLRPDTTMHLGPLLLALVPAFLGRDSDHPQRGVLVGTGIGAMVITILSITGNLDGPSLSGFPDALTESIVLLAIGGTGGLVYVASTGRHGQQ